ncbi:TetR/AcrR family transcriptional regulator [Peribacillus deserti]|uniref:TetR family transcriptional regulator n=1 Tax=Peribacillus deserti TaxID=673318 RepID=A0A2N5M1F9_9BACI|nr:TetR/AcrR family transcriptional regulator [Peribacillus deserti]PLT28224.1 TetR family transcriptional regulator [Peribacillus deserti]
MKDKITAAAISLFDKKGFSETSIQDIVESLSVTKGTFYYYFSSKEELLKDIHLGYIDELVARQESIIHLENQNSKDKLFQIVYMLIHDIKDHGASAKVFSREIRHLSEENYQIITQKRDQFRFNIEYLLKEGMNKGEFRSSLNVPLIAFGILGVTNWSYQWYNPEGASSDREIAETFTEMILQGIEPK